MTAVTSVPGAGDEGIRHAAARVMKAGESRPRPGRDPVNLPMIRNWVEALGDANPVYVDAAAARAAGHPGLVAPPAMIQVWTMPGLRGVRTADDPLGAMMTALDEAGYPAVVATNCEQTYHRYLREGESVRVTTRLDSVVGPKRTALGEGWFVTTTNTWFVEDEPVAEMLFRVLKFRPAAEAPARELATEEPATAEKAPPPAPAPSTGAPLRPVLSLDTAFFWEGAAAGELRVQNCQACGTLRHPPGPMCPNCGSDDVGHVVVDGVGSVFSYVVHHHPPVPGRTAPFVVALIELVAGVRMLGELVDIEPGEVEIGCPVEVVWQRIDETLTVPAWRPR